MTSSRRTLYLDYNATAPLRPEARAAVLAVMDAPGNASSVHGAGRRARDRIETARGQVAALVGAPTPNLVFTSGGTEANVLALTSLAATPSTLLVGATEHDAVMQTARSLGRPCEVWPVDAHGVADLDWLEDRLARWTTADGLPVVALMLANNETGVIQPVAEAAARVHSAGGRMHVDAVQAAGKIDIDVAALGADTLALSAHKLGGPQGAGAVVHAAGVKLKPLWHGGGQEQGLRPGTENVCAIIGFGAAALVAAADLDRLGAMALWRDRAASRLKSAGALVAGEGAMRLPNTLCVTAEGWDSARQVMWLDLGGVQASAGSACASGKVRASGVLTAMGLEAQAPFAVRASGGWASTEDDWSAFADLWLDGYARVTARQRTEVA